MDHLPYGSSPVRDAKYLSDSINYITLPLGDYAVCKEVRGKVVYYNDCTYYLWS